MLEIKRERERERKKRMHFTCIGRIGANFDLKKNQLQSKSAEEKSTFV